MKIIKVVLFGHEGCATKFIELEAEQKTKIYVIKGEYGERRIPIENVENLTDMSWTTGYFPRFCYCLPGKEQAAVTKLAGIAKCRAKSDLEYAQQALQLLEKWEL